MAKSNITLKDRVEALSHIVDKNTRTVESMQYTSLNSQDILLDAKETINDYRFVLYLSTIINIVTVIALGLKIAA